MTDDEHATRVTAYYKKLVADGLPENVAAAVTVDFGRAISAGHISENELTKADKKAAIDAAAAAKREGRSVA